MSFRNLSSRAGVAAGPYADNFTFILMVW